MLGCTGFLLFPLWFATSVVYRYNLVMVKDFSPEYIAYMNSPEWRFRAMLIRSLFLGRDCIFPLLKATDCHHLKYNRFRNEIAIIDVVPLNRATHQIADKIRKSKRFGHIGNNIIRGIACSWLALEITIVAKVLIFMGAFR